MIWAVYLLFLAGAFGGLAQAIRLSKANREAGRPRPRSHEELP